MQKKEKPLWHLHRSSEIESVDELQFASGRWMKPIQHFPKPKTEERQKSRQTPSTAVIPTVAIHRGNHVIIPNGQTMIHEDDKVTIFCLLSDIGELEKLMTIKRGLLR